MRVALMISVLVGGTLLLGCSDSRSTQRIATEERAGTRQNDAELLSREAALFPLSPYYAVCAKHVPVLRATFRNGVLGLPTFVELVVDGGTLRVSVGGIAIDPGIDLQEVASNSPPRRILLHHDTGESSMYVSGFDGMGGQLVAINFDTGDPGTQAAALKLANSIVACRVSASPETGER